MSYSFSLLRHVTLASFIVTALLSLVVPVANAQTPFGQPIPAGCDGFNPQDPYGLDCPQYSGLSARDPRLIVARVINVTLGLLGILAVAIVVYAGFTWMTSGGNDEQIKKARGMLLAAVIGLVLILSAYSIANFILLQLNTATR
jgi:type IV secretory pathway VirB2 component (pilin)